MGIVAKSQHCSSQPDLGHMVNLKFHRLNEVNYDGLDCIGCDVLAMGITMGMVMAMCMGITMGMAMCM